MIFFKIVHKIFVNTHLLGLLWFLLDHRLLGLGSFLSLLAWLLTITCVHYLVLPVEHIRVEKRTLVGKGRVFKNFAKVLQELL